MIVLVKRGQPDSQCVISDVLVNGEWSFYGLEPEQGKGPIPEGTYDLVVNWSNRFGRLMPEVLNVPGFDGIRIHPGNWPHDSEGCLLIGAGKSVDEITNSRSVFDDFFPKLQSALDAHEQCTITYQDYVTWSSQ